MGELYVIIGALVGVFCTRGFASSLADYANADGKPGMLLHGEREDVDNPSLLCWIFGFIYSLMICMFFWPIVLYLRNK